MFIESRQIGERRKHFEALRPWLRHLNSTEFRRPSFYSESNRRSPGLRKSRDFGDHCTCRQCMGSEESEAQSDMR